MVNLKNKNGMTLVALVITIIVLLILAGISILIADNFLIDKAISASNKTIESSIEEQVSLALNECEASYWTEKIENANLEKEDYFRNNFSKCLEGNKDFKNINLAIDEDIRIDFKYKNKEYSIFKSSDGKINMLYDLKGNVRLGEYLEYNIEYTDVYSEENYTAQNGWIIIDDGVMKGTSGKIRIISAGIPAKWNYNKEDYENTDVAIEKLTTDFENLELKNRNGDIILGSSFKDDLLSQNITILSLSDFNHAYNAKHGKKRKSDDTSPIMEDDIALGFKDSDQNYWLSTNDGDNLYYVTSKGIKSQYSLKCGIKPVISLKEDLKAIYHNGIWKIINEGGK